MSSYTIPNPPPFDPTFMFSKVMQDDAQEEDSNNKEDDKYSKNRERKKIINRGEGVINSCPMCGQTRLKKGEEGNNESFKIQLLVINDEDTGVEQYVCGMCNKFMTFVISKGRIKVSPQFTMPQGE